VKGQFHNFLTLIISNLYDTVVSCGTHIYFEEVSKDVLGHLVSQYVLLCHTGLE